MIHFISVKELRKEYELLKLKRMLFEYGITDFNYTYSNISIAWVSHTHTHTYNMYYTYTVHVQYTCIVHVVMHTRSLL